MINKSHENDLSVMVALLFHIGVPQLMPSTCCFIILQIICGGLFTFFSLLESDPAEEPVPFEEDL